MSNLLKQLYDDLANDVDYITERKKIQIAELISKLMEEKNITKAELARKLNTTRQSVTKFLRGDNNFTIKTINLINI